MIPIKSQSEIEIMRQGGKHLAQILNLLAKQVKPGTNTQDLDKLAGTEIKKINGWPAFKGYRGFPTSICTCINEEVVHAPAIPNRILKDGDILSIDIGLRYPIKNGLITDTAITIPVGKISKSTKKLLEITKKSLDIAIKKIKPGIYLGDISYEIQKLVEKNKFNVVYELAGHGVGHKLHEPPQIPNYGEKGTGPILKHGMTLAIEPMVVNGRPEVIEDKKTSAFKTKDNSLAAHFEHTVLITEKGSAVLTHAN